MGNVSPVGIIISGIVSILFLIELILFFGAFRVEKRGHLIIHLLGTVTAALVAFCTIAATLSIAIESAILIKVVVILAVVFFIVAAINSLIVEKEEKILKGKRK